MSPLTFDPDALRKIRRGLGLTQRALAERMGLSLKTVRCWEQRRRTPSLPTISRMADELGVDFTLLLTREPHAPRKAVAA